VAGEDSEDKILLEVAVRLAEKGDYPLVFFKKFYQGVFVIETERIFVSEEAMQTGGFHRHNFADAGSAGKDAEVFAVSDDADFIEGERIFQKFCEGQGEYAVADGARL